MSKIHILLLIVYVFAPFLHSEGSTSVHPTLSNICKKTGNAADLCISTIAPGFNGREADASSALKEAIRVTATRYEEAKKFADKLAHEATTPRNMIGSLDVCKQLFDSSLEKFQDIPRAFNDQNDPDGLNIKQSAISTNAETCITTLHEGTTEKSPLEPVVSELNQLVDLCWQIGAQLRNSKDVARTCKAKGTTAHVDPTVKVDPSLSDMCKGTDHNDLCVSTIAPVLKGAKADALSALKVEIQAATSKCNEATQLVDNLVKDGTTRSELVKALNVCNKAFQSSLKDLQASQKDIDNGDHDVGDKLNAIFGYLKTCKTSLKKINAEDSPVYTVRSDLFNLIENCFSFNIMLTIPKYYAPAAADAAGSSSSSKAKGTAAQDLEVHPTLSNICKEIIHPDICVSTVAPLLKGGKADAVSVLRAEIQAAASKCNEATQLVGKLVKDGTTPSELVRALNVCNEKFHSALKDLQATEKAIDGGDREVSDKIGVIGDYVRSCEDSLSKINAKDSPVSTVVSDLHKLTDNCHSLNLVMGDPQFAVPAAA